MTGHRFFYFGLIAVALSAIVVQGVAYYYFQATNRSESVKSTSLCRGLETTCVRVNTLINFGNGTATWHNASDVPATWNLYTLTTHIANVVSESYSFGHQVTSIDGASESGSSHWWLWTYCSAKSGWSFSSVGADSLSLTDTSTFAWALGPDSSHSPLGGETTVDSC